MAARPSDDPAPTEVGERSEQRQVQRPGQRLMITPLPEPPPPSCCCPCNEPG